jgi:cyclase
MLAKRVIPCLDVRAGVVTKGVRFEGNVDLGDPVEYARRYYEEGADEIVFYDITASAEKREIMIDVVRRVAEEIFIPFAVGGGLRTVDDMRRVLLAGADKVSVNSAAVRRPEILREGAEAFGSQCIVLGVDVLRVGPKTTSGYEVVIDGGRVPTGLDAIDWVRKAVDLGAGEICVNSIDADGTMEGYELAVTGRINDAVPVPVIASGGAGNPDHVVEMFRRTDASAALVASIVHSGEFPIPAIKKRLRAEGIPVRTDWAL